MWMTCRALFLKEILKKSLKNIHTLISRVSKKYYLSIVIIYKN